MEAWPGRWEIAESLNGVPDCPNTGTAIYIMAEGGWVAKIMPCSNPRLAFKNDSLPDCGDVPGTEEYHVGLAIARATAKEIVDAHNSREEDTRKMIGSKQKDLLF